jgi:threonine/homoserine/homoserine lactone efflux protein
MDLFTLVAYAIAVIVPGPGVAAVVARSLGGGFRAGFAMVLGILAGDLVYLVFALFGLAAIATHFSALFTLVRWAGALYLLYIAWQFWTATPGKEQIGPRAGEHWLRTFLAGLALTLGNPKTIIFYLALLPTIVPLDRPVTALGFVELVVIVTLVLLVIGCGYAWLAAAAREFFTSRTALRRLNRVAAVIMAGAATFVVIRE